MLLLTPGQRHYLSEVSHVLVHVYLMRTSLFLFHLRLKIITVIWFLFSPSKFPIVFNYLFMCLSLVIYAPCAEDRLINRCVSLIQIKPFFFFSLLFFYFFFLTRSKLKTDRKKLEMKGAMPTWVIFVFFCVLYSSVGPVISF